MKTSFKGYVRDVIENFYSFQCYISIQVQVLCLSDINTFRMMVIVTSTKVNFSSFFCLMQ